MVFPSLENHYARLSRLGSGLSRRQTHRRQPRAALPRQAAPRRSLINTAMCRLMRATPTTMAIRASRRILVLQRYSGRVLRRTLCRRFSTKRYDQQCSTPGSWNLRRVKSDMEQRFCWVVIMGAAWETTAFSLRAVGAHHQQELQYALWGQLLFLLAPLCK